MKIHGSFLLFLALGGCAHQSGPGSVSHGECKTFERPEYAVKGKRQYDQDWIDSAVEGGVGACGWQRPAARPAQLDAPAVKAKPPAKVAKKKPAWLGFVHGLRRPETAPATASEAAPEPVAAPEAPPAPAPRRPIDILLGGSK